MWARNNEQIAVELHWQITRLFAFAVDEAHSRIGNDVAKANHSL
jgi:hypothetical protein